MPYQENEPLNGQPCTTEAAQLQIPLCEPLNGQPCTAEAAQPQTPRCGQENTAAGDDIFTFSPENEPPFPIADNELPPVMREIVTNAPPSRKIPSFVACLAPLCALATRIRLKYFYDSRPSALLLQVLIEGNQSVGKSYAADIENLIMGSTLKARDNRQRLMEQEYREKKKKRRANEKLDDEPQTTIRVIPATISKTVLTRRADFYQRILGDTLTFWMFAEELAQVTDAGKQGYSNLRTIMRTAYDLGSLFGIDYASDNSYSAIVDINICSMFCSTPAALDDYMDKQSIEGGNITRCIRCELSDTLGADGVIFKPYSPRQLKVINHTLSLMMDHTYAPSGNLMPVKYLDMSWLNKDVRYFCLLQGHRATLSGSVALDVFRKRSSVSAFRIAALCYYLYSLESTNETEARNRCRKIYDFMSHYILHNMLTRWGKRFEELNAKRCYSADTPPQGLFFSLPEEFSRDQLQLLIDQQGLTTPARQFLWTWRKNNNIEVIDNNHFRKVGTMMP